MEIDNALMVSAAGMRAQNVRMRIIAENMANADSTALSTGEDPYRRKILTFKNELDREMGVSLVEVHRVNVDKADFGQRYDPGHPAANEEGYVRTTNVNGLIEGADLRQAEASYRANLNAMEATKRIATATVELLR